MSNWWAFLSWYENFIVWPLAIGAFLLLLKAKRARWRATFGVLLVLVFLPHIQKAVGDVYFDYLCRTQAGEFIYRTVDNVEGILQMRPRDGSKDYFDRMRAGDIPEDPYGHTNREAQRPWTMIGDFQFIETSPSEATTPSDTWRGFLHESMYRKPGSTDKIVRFHGYDGRNLNSFRKEFAVEPISKYGFTWQQVGGPLMWALNVYRGDIDVRELASGEVLARMTGFYRSRPMAICPPGKHDSFVIDFVQRVLRPTKRVSPGN